MPGLLLLTALFLGASVVPTQVALAQDNLIPSGDFESAAPGSALTVSPGFTQGTGDSSFTITDAEAHTGDQSLLVDYAGDADQPFNFQFVFQPTVEAGTEYTASVWAKSASGAGQMQFAVQQNGGDYAAYGTPFYGTVLPTDWTEYVITFTVPEGVESVNVGLAFGYETNVGNAVYVDDLSLTANEDGGDDGALAMSFINEFHYDNDGGDVGERVEIAVPSDADAGDLVLTLYNGSNGASYETITGDAFTAGSTSDGYTFYVAAPMSIQNGEPDGFSLSTSGGTLIQFISYEGAFTAAGGPADGQTSTDVGVSEPGNTPVGQSLQLTGTGLGPDEFTWTGPLADSFGSINAGQTFGMGGGEDDGIDYDGSTIVVTTPLDVVAADGLCSLREAVQAANTNSAVNDCTAGTGNDRIGFSPSIATTPILLTDGELTISENLLIDGTMPFGNRTTVDGSDNSRIFDVAEDVTTAFTALVLQNGNSAMNSSAPNAGGAVDLKANASATFTDVDVLDSEAGINGGGIHGGAGATVVITTTETGTSTISGNVALGPDAGMGGGGVWGAGTTTISGNVTITNNSATGTSGSGGGVLNFGGVLTIADATISNNTANRAGGGIEDFGDDDDDTDVTLTEVTVTGNSIATANPGNGGGLHSGGGEIVINGGTFSANAATEGGGIWTSGALTLTGTTVQANTTSGTAADNGGGGLYNEGGTMMLTNATVQANVSTTGSASGGGILNAGGDLTVTGGSFVGNQSARAGGGIETAGGTVAVNGSTFTNNDAGSAPGNGGAFHGGGDATATFDGVTATNNVAVEGGGLWISAAGSLTVTGSFVNNNTASGADANQGGGGLYSDGGSLTVMNTQVNANTATGTSGSGGGILVYGGSFMLTGGEVNANTANRAGGGIELNGANPAATGTTVTITGTTINANNAGANPGNGGGLHAGGASDLTITDATINANTAVEGGGFWINAGGDLTATNVTANNNTATGADADKGGGAFYNDGGMASITGSTFIENTASGTSGSGGAILNNSGMLTVRESTFRSNTANRAGGAVEDIGGTGSMASFTDVTFASNDAGDNPGNGGAIHITGAGTVRVDSSMVQSNVAGGQGGGLWNFNTASMDVTYTTVDGNSAPIGGGLYQQGGDGNDGVLMFANSTASNNEASNVGGGVFADGATVQIENSTVSGNSADTGAGVASRGGRVLLSNATIANNTAGSDGGGLANLSPDFGDGDDSDDADADAASISPDNTIVADNTADGDGDNLFGPIMSRGYNLFATTDGATMFMDDDATGDITGVDAELGDLADNGGPTLTHAIALTSPAVNAGMTSLMIDQRGADRVSTPDIGAFESDAAPTPDEEFVTEFADGEDMKMSALAPNPFSGTATVQLAVRQSQAVRVALYDVMGREVHVFHDGPMAGSVGLDVEVDAAGLASGVYILAVRGESVSGSQRVTVVR